MAFIASVKKKKKPLVSFYKLVILRMARAIFFKFGTCLVYQHLHSKFGLVQTKGHIATVCFEVWHILFTVELSIDDSLLHF